MDGVADGLENQVGHSIDDAARETSGLLQNVSKSLKVRSLQRLSAVLLDLIDCHGSFSNRGETVASFEQEVSPVLYWNRKLLAAVSSFSAHVLVKVEVASARGLCLPANGERGATAASRVVAKLQSMLIDGEFSESYLLGHAVFSSVGEERRVEVRYFVL